MAQSLLQAYFPTVYRVVAASMDRYDLNVLIARRRRQVQRGEYRLGGKLNLLYMEGDAVANQTESNILVVENATRNASIDWAGKGPRLGYTADNEILFLDALPFPPNLPKRNWTPAAEFAGQTKENPGGELVPQSPPMERQRWQDRASGILPSKDGPWAVFNGVHLIKITRADKTGWDNIECVADLSGRHTALLMNLETQEAHFVYGKKNFDSARM